jgi:hypothetical protein
MVSPDAGLQPDRSVRLAEPASGDLAKSFDDLHHVFHLIELDPTVMERPQVRRQGLATFLDQTHEVRYKLIGIDRSDRGVRNRSLRLDVRRLVWLRDVSQDRQIGFARPGASG